MNINPAQLSVSNKAHVEVAGRRRPMTNKDIQIVLDKSARRKDGSYRMLASLAIKGKPVGPFSYEGTRSDDPNDTLPHERRRDLRGLRVFCAWLNHTDSKSGNTLSTLVEENGIRFVRHYLIDFGAILGSDSDRPKDARFGKEYIFPEPKEVLKTTLSLGFHSPAWERTKYPKNPAIGRFELSCLIPKSGSPTIPIRHS